MKSLKPGDVVTVQGALAVKTSSNEGGAPVVTLQVNVERALALSVSSQKARESAEKPHRGTRRIDPAGVARANAAWHAKNAPRIDDSDQADE